MVASHDPYLVALSVLISILAAYAARDLSERITGARGWDWLAWLVGGATASGICIWSMHFTGMQAFSLPVPVWYDWPTVFVSLLVGVIGSAAALFVLSRGAIRWLQVLAASILMGAVGISGLHYTAMAAMRLQGIQHHSHALMALAVVLSIVISFMALALMFLFRDDGRGRSLRKHGSALLMGAANPVMHFVAMAGLTVSHSDELPDLSHALSISAPGILGMGGVPVMFLIVALVTSLADRLHKERVLLNELFEQAPQAVALMNADNGLVRVNRGFTQLFGYSAQEAVGRRLSQLIVPAELQDEEQRYAERAAIGQRVEAECIRQHKDGSRLHVSMVSVPVSIPGGQVEIYAIYRDITERKRAEEAQRESTGRLQRLTRRLLEVQEEERRHLARELHDEFGQVLATITLHLHAARGLAGEGALAQLDECATLLQQAGDQVRSLALELRPTMLDTIGLEATLRWLAEQHQQRTGWEVQVVGHLSETLPSAELAIACFRVAQEALTNVVRHAAARHVWIEVSQNESVLELVVRDDGVGFDVASTQEQAAKRGSLGLLGMAERVQLLGGTLRVESEPGRGTRIRASFPLSEVPDQPADPEE